MFRCFFVVVSTGDVWTGGQWQITQSMQRATNMVRKCWNQFWNRGKWQRMYNFAPD